MLYRQPLFCNNTWMKKPNLFRRWIILIGIVLLIAFSLKAYRDYLLSPLDLSAKTQKTFIISRGEGTREVAQRLEKEGLIRSANAFTLLVQSTGNVGKIQAGDFKISPSMSASDILGELKTGKVDKSVILLEGWRREEMGEKLGAELGLKSSEIVKVAKEGYMFPDTYMFSPHSDVALIVQKMEDNFNSKYDAVLQSKIRSQGLTPEQGVILASIVEREGRSPEVKKMIASILLKRLKIGMGINADATIQYALGYQRAEGSWWKRNLTRDDLKIESTYNTYLHAGLPPAPICNPGLASLQAVANANSSIPYLYYYHDSKGRSHYAKTLEEHNRNVANYP